MKNIIKMKKFSYLFLMLAMVTTIVSCDQEESIPDESDISLQEVVGKWVVDIVWAGDPYDTNTISTYNTSNNDTDAIWLDDLGHGWGLKAKVNYDPDTMTFSGTDLDELYYGVTVTITEGRIIKGGATTPTGEVVDSISFKAEFSDIPGEIWEYYGYKSTAQVDDLP